MLHFFGEKNCDGNSFVGILNPAHTNLMEFKDFQQFADKASIKAVYLYQQFFYFSSIARIFAGLSAILLKIATLPAVSF